MTRPLYMTKIKNETEAIEGGMQKVTPEYFANRGYSETELREIAQLQVDQLWMAPGRGHDRSVIRVA